MAARREAPSSPLEKSVESMMPRYWTLRPDDGYLPPLLDSRDNGAKIIFPPRVGRFYSTVLRRSPLYNLSLAAALTLGHVGLYTTFLHSGEPTDIDLTAFGALSAACYAFYTLAVVPELQLQLLRRLFSQFEGWLSVFQCIPPVFLFSYINRVRGQNARACGFVLGIIATALAPFLLDSMPHLGGSTMTILLVIEGTLVAALAMLLMAGKLYFSRYEGMEETELVIFKIPIRPWLIAADSLVVIAVLHAQFLFRYIMAARRRKAKGGSLRFTTIKWPLTIEEDVSSKRRLERLSSLQAAAPGPLEEDEGAVLPTTEPPRQAQSVPDTPKNKKRQRMKGGRKVYKVRPVQEPFSLDNFSDTLQYICWVVNHRWRRLGPMRKSNKTLPERPDRGERSRGASSLTTTPCSRDQPASSSSSRDSTFAPSVSRFVGQEPTLSALAAAATIIQAALVEVDGPLAFTVLFFFVGFSANVLLVGRAHPVLLLKLTKSFDFAVMLFSLLEVFVFACFLLSWDTRCFSVTSVALTVISSLIMQDTVIMPLQRRKRWLVFHFVVLLLVELTCGVYLVFLTPHDDSSSLLGHTANFLSGVTRSPLSLALDALATVIMHTVRSLLSMVQSPHLLVSIMSDVAYEIDFIQDPPDAKKEAIEQADPTRPQSEGSKCKKDCKGGQMLLEGPSQKLVFEEPAGGQVKELSSTEDGSKDFCSSAPG